MMAKQHIKQQQPNVEQNPHPNTQGVRNGAIRKAKDHHRSMREHGIIRAEKERNRSRDLMRDAKKEGVDREAILPEANSVRRSANHAQARKRSSHENNGFDHIVQAMLRGDGKFLVNMPEHVLGAFFIRLWHVWFARKPNPRNLESVARVNWAVPEDALFALRDKFSKGDANWLLDVALNNVGRNAQVVGVRDESDPEHQTIMYFRSPVSKFPKGAAITLWFALPEEVQKHGARLIKDPRISLENVSTVGPKDIQPVPLFKLREGKVVGAKISKKEQKRSRKRAEQSNRDRCNNSEERRVSAAEKLA